MALLPQFDTPARLRDMPAGSPFYSNWSRFISNRIGAVTPGDNGGAFYDPTETNVNVVGEKGLVWQAFPRDTILTLNRDDKEVGYIDADATPATRQDQNEYFEWFIDRNGGKIEKVTFTTEFGGYYQEMWNVDPGAVVALYQTLLSNPGIAQSDLESAPGVYNKFNVYNTTKGIVHLIQGINNLPAAIGLAQGAVRAAPPFRDNYEARPGLSGARTNVDPRVSFDVHMLVRKGLYVTFKDPVGIYIADWDNSGITKPDGAPAPASWWNVVRENGGLVLRVEYEVPPGEGFLVGDLKIGGRRIEYGGQLAEHMAVVLFGTAGTPARG
jgi:hypothetical protein